MPKICLRFAQDWPEWCVRYVWDIPEVFSINSNWKFKVRAQDAGWMS